MTEQRRDIVGVAVQTGLGVANVAQLVETLSLQYGSGYIVAEKDPVLGDHILTAEAVELIHASVREPSTYEDPAVLNAIFGR